MAVDDGPQAEAEPVVCTHCRVHTLPRGRGLLHVPMVCTETREPEHACLLPLFLESKRIKRKPSFVKWSVSPRILCRVRG